MRGTTEDRKSFFVSMPFRAFLKVRRKERHIAQTSVPNKGSGGSALQGHNQTEVTPSTYKT